MFFFILTLRMEGIGPSVPHFPAAIPKVIRWKRRAVEKAIKIFLAGILPKGVEYRIYHHASKSNYDLQIAAYCNWAVFRKWEKKDARSYDIIRRVIRSEFDIFQSGTRYYY